MIKRIKVKLILSFVVFLILALGVFCFRMLSIPHTAYAQGDGEIHYEIDYVPVEKVAIEVQNNADTVKPGESIRLGVSIIPYYAAQTVKEIKYDITTGSDYASIDTNGKLKVSPDAPVGGVISVTAMADNVESEAYIFTVIKIPVTKVLIYVSPASEIKQGGTLELMCDVFPKEASYPERTYEILSGQQYASVDINGIITISNNIKNPNATFSVRATADGVESNELILSIYVPTTKIELTADKYTAVSTETTGDTITLSVAVSEFATINNPQFYISHPEYWNFDNGLLTIMSGIQGDIKIRIYAEQDDVYSNEITIDIYVPVTEIWISAAKNTINKGSSLQLSTRISPAYVSASAIYYEVTNGEQFGTITSDGIIIINDIITVPNASITVRASRDNVASNSLTFSIYIPATELFLTADNLNPVSSVYEGDAVTIFAEADEAATGSPKLEIIYGADFADLKEITFKEYILIINPGITASNPYVIIEAICDDASKTITIHIQTVRVESVTISADTNILNQGEIYHLTQLKIQPFDANRRWATFSIIEGNAYASIFTSTDGLIGLIYVNSIINSKNAVIKIKATVDNIDSNILTFNIYVPTSSLTLTADILNPRLGDTVMLSSYVSAYASINNPTYTIIFHDELAILSGNIIIINKDIAILNPMVQIMAEQDGIFSYITLNIEIPLEAMSFPPEDTPSVITEGGICMLGNPMFFPYNATNVMLIFSIVSGGEYGSITPAGSLKINETINVPHAIIVVKATTADGKISSNYVSISILIPVKTISLEASKTRLISTSTSGDSLILTPTFNSLATDKTLTYVFESGENLVQSINGNTLIISKNSAGGIIRLYAENGDVKSNKIIIEVYVPVESITFDISSLNRGHNTVTPIFNPNATDKRWEIESVFPLSVTVDSSSNTINVPMNLVYNTKIIINYRASETGGESFSKTFIVAKLTGIFSIEYSKDSQGYILSDDFPQLQIGKHVNITPKYNGLNLPEGITASIISITNATISGFRITANSTAAGNAAILYIVKILDGKNDAGTDNYYLITKTISVFRPLTGKPSISNATIYNKETTLTKNAGTLDTLATNYLLSNFKFVEDDGANYKLTADGKFTVKSITIPSSIGIRLTFTQNYNGETIVYRSDTIVLTIKTVILNKQSGKNGTDGPVIAINNLSGRINSPDRTGYIFGGYFSGTNGSGTQYYDSYGNRTSNQFTTSYPELFAKWTAITYNVTVYTYDGSNWKTIKTDIYTYGYSYSWEAYSWDGYEWNYWHVDRGNGDEIWSYSYKATFSNLVDVQGKNVKIYASYVKKSCVTEGTLITLADGSQKAVENLNGSELLLVWNLYTGSFDVAPILFVDRDIMAEYEIIHLYFSDGTEVKVIFEHAFWDYDLNQYVFLRKDAAQYIGHWFNKQITDSNGKLVWTKTQLVNVEIYTEYTTAWSPVTFAHLCYYVNGVLSMPGSTEGLINIFKVNQESMQVDEIQMKLDILKYGLFTYEEFAKIVPIPEIIFEAFGGQYLKVSIGKGLINWDILCKLLEQYSRFFN